MEERKYDLYSDEFRASAHETYTTMREQDPVFRQARLDGTTPIWFVTRHGAPARPGRCPGRAHYALRAVSEPPAGNIA